MNQSELVRSLPPYLRRFVAEQSYGRYTAQDHAVWRFILHQLQRVLSKAAHPVYLQGLAQTGISLEHVPSIDEMNACLSRLGWAAVVVDGFIPPAVFMEFQARRILPIALSMRSIEQILYTPAPDIVHESAGHAPFIVDADYAEYLQRFGEVGMKAISTQADYAVYLAVRHLSMVKGTPGASAAEIRDARERLDAALAANDNRSEAALLSRLHWWTVEYGLVGEVDDYRIYGAGLLSSLGESVSCQDDRKVRKLPLTVECIRTAYDITNPQPQLFVAKSCVHLVQVLEAFADGMAFRIGGATGLQRAIDSGMVCTAQYDSGLEVSGVFTRLLADAVGNPVYLGTTGPTQLAHRSQQLAGHGIDDHREGFGSPVGRIQGLTRNLQEYSIDELAAKGIAGGHRIRLPFVSGVIVDGQLERILREEHHNLVLRFSDCRVTGLAGETLFDPAWGAYDMAVGTRIVSVWGGPADRAAFDCFQQPPASSPEVRWSERDQRLFAIYDRIRALRESGEFDDGLLREILGELAEFPQAWLPRLSLYELAGDALAAQLKQELQRLARELPGDAPRLIGMGLDMPRLRGRRPQPA